MSGPSSGAIWTPDVEGAGLEMRSPTRFPSHRYHPYDLDVLLRASDGHEAAAL